MIVVVVVYLLSDNLIILYKEMLTGMAELYENAVNFLPHLSELLTNCGSWVNYKVWWTVTTNLATSAQQLWRRRRYSLTSYSGPGRHVSGVSGKRIRIFFNPLSLKWKFLYMRCRTRIMLTLNPDVFFFSDVTISSPVLNCEYSRRFPAQYSVSLLYFFDFMFKSCKVCAVIPMITQYCTLQSCQTAARHFEASFHVGQTNWTS